MLDAVAPAEHGRARTRRRLHARQHLLDRRIADGVDGELVAEAVVMRERLVHLCV